MVYPVLFLKALCCDATFYFPTEASKFVEILEEKHIRVRAPLEEVKLCLDATATTLDKHCMDAAGTKSSF